MADPILNEEAITQALDTVVDLQTINRLHAGALMSIVDAWDRKILRDEFVVLVDAAMKLTEHTAKLWLIHKVKEAHSKQRVNEAALLKATHDIKVNASGALNELSRLVDR